MNASVQVKIIAAERLNDGLVIKFADGQSGFYAASLLWAVFAQAESLDESKLVW